MVSTDYSGKTITISWTAPEDDGGSVLTSYDLWIDDGAGSFSSSTAVSHTDTANLQYQFTTLTQGATYGFKV